MEFEQLWGAKSPSIVAGWRRHWEEIIPRFAFAPEIRRLIYTTNAIESLHRGLRKIIKTRGHFPSDQAAGKLLFLALRNIEKGWKAAPKEWLPALNQFDILFGDGLAGIHGNLGDLERARANGEISLRLKDALTAGQRPPVGLPEVPVPACRRDELARNVIAFSLWGQQERHRYPALLDQPHRLKLALTVELPFLLHPDPPVP